MTTKNKKKSSRYTKLVGMELKKEISKLKKHKVVTEVYDKEEMQNAFKKASKTAMSIIKAKKV